MSRKNAIVVSGALPVGLAVNAAGVLAVTLGSRVEDLVGRDVEDAAGVLHPGIIAGPLPVLSAAPAVVRDIVATALPDDDLFCVAFSSLAQSCRTYDEYVRRMTQTPTAEPEPVAVALVGPRKKVDRLVGALPLLR